MIFRNGSYSMIIKGTVLIKGNILYGADDMADIPGGITEIGPCAFANCTSLSLLIIPEDVKVIDEYAFANCAGLDEVRFPSGLRSIEKNAFLNCDHLSKVIISRRTKVHKSAFANCGRFEVYYLEDKNALYRELLMSVDD